MALNTYRRAAATGFSRSQLALADCYISGTGAAKDSAAAYEWYCIAAANNEARALYVVATHLATADSLAAHSKRALRRSSTINYFKKAAKEGNAEAQYHLARFYHTGRYVRKSNKKAFEWYMHAANNNHPQAAEQVARCYEKGRGTNEELMPPTVMFTLEGVNIPALLDHVAAHPEEMAASCATIDTKEGYDAAYFRADPNFVFVGMTALFSRLKAEGKCPVERGNMIIINGLHPGQVYVNTSRLLHTDATNIMDLTRAELEGHLQVGRLVETFRAYVPGFENCYVSSIAPSLGVRETRRFRGIKTLTVEQALRAEIPDDTVCLSGYKIDIHKDCETATLFQTVEEPFGVPYGTLVSAEIDNLLFAGRCISVDESVIGSTRVMPCCMATGQAAAVGAVLAHTRGQLPAQVNTDDIRAELLAGGAMLTQE
jgi:hypothetical protein